MSEHPQNPPAPTCSRPVRWGRVHLGAGRPAVAVALTGPTTADAVAQAARASGAGADVLELRLDLADDVRAALATPSATAAAAQAARAATDLLARVVTAAPGTPVLITLRSQAEGGGAPVTDEVYRDVLLALVEATTTGPCAKAAGGGSGVVAVDVELARGCVRPVAAAARRAGLDVVASFHDFSGTPDEEALVHRLARMEELGADVAKVAVTPHDPVDVARLLTATARARESLRVPLVTIAMGELGAVTRLAGSVFGSSLTFAVVPDPAGDAVGSAPGQLPITTVRSALDLLGPARTP